VRSPAGKHLTYLKGMYAVENKRPVSDWSRLGSSDSAAGKATL
jgi:hypothetical protein